MDLKQMRCTLPNEAACRRVDMSQDEAVLILLQHCQDMKRQETRLRLVSLLLMLSCVALFIFSQFQTNSGATGQRGAATPSRAYSRQDRERPAADPQTDNQKMKIDLTSTYEPNSSVTTMKWNVLFGENYDEKARAIVIPKDGIFFFYLTVTFRCNCQNTDFDELHVRIMTQSEGASRKRELISALDSVQCKEGLYRTVSVMRQSDLAAGDKVSVSLENGRELITYSSFGAFQT